MSASQPAIDHNAPKNVDFQELVTAADMGGRKPPPAVASFLSVVAIAWSLFQLWYASPIAYTIGVAVFNDTEARVVHLVFALLLAFTAYPAFSTSPRDRIPI